LRQPAGGREFKGTGARLGRVITSRMGELVSHFFEFLWDVLVNWRNLIAVVVFTLFSFPNAALSNEARANFDARWPPDFRRKWLVRIATGYVFFACFLAWNEQRGMVVELQSQRDTREQRGEIAKKITVFVQEGNKIAKTFEDKDDKDLIKSQFNDWNSRCDAMLNASVGESYAATIRICTRERTGFNES
jgi:hypothetical protein